MLLIFSLFLALIPFLGFVAIVLRGTILTVDGLFTSLILLMISAVFGGSAYFAYRDQKQHPSASAPLELFPDGIIRRGRVENVQFFESAVGQPNKSVVTISDTGPLQTMVFEGDLRNALPAGHKVEITFRKDSGHNVLLDVSYP